jgi:hypothetical protein
MKPPRQPEDSILSPQEMAADGGMSEATWYRNYRVPPRPQDHLDFTAQDRCPVL